MTSLYVLSGEYKVLEAKLKDSEFDEQTIMDTLEGAAGELEEKALNVAKFCQNLEAEAEAIKVAIVQMSERQKRIKARADSIRKYLHDNMERTGITSITCPYFEIKLKNNPASVVIDDESLIESQYLRIPPLPDPVPDKKAIADAIKSGQEVKGAHLVQTTRVEIK